MSTRGFALIAVALALCGGLLWVQLARGGADFVPTPPADPCQDRGRTSTADLEGVAEIVVLTGLDEAACDLGVSRERLLLALPSQTDRAALAREAGTDEAGLALAIKDGMRAGVDRLERTGRLPSTSALLPSIADELGISQNLVDLVPDGVVDDLLPTGDVLRWSLDNIHVDAVLAGIDDGESLETILREQLVDGAIAQAREKIQGALPGPLQGLF